MYEMMSLSFFCLFFMSESAGDKLTLEKVHALGIQPNTIRIVSYWKYSFQITATTVDNRTLKIECGGDHERIYRFSPTGGWNEWMGAGLDGVKLDGVEIDFDAWELMKLMSKSWSRGGSVI